MNRDEFLSALRNELSGVPAEDIDPAIEYYGEMIDDRMEDGMDEEEAVCDIGTPGDAAAQILSEIPLTKLVKAKIKPNRTLKLGEIILLILGFPVWLPVLLAIGIVMLTVYIVLWVLVAVVYIIFFSLAVSAVGCLALTVYFLITGHGAVAGMAFGSAFVLAGFSILLFLAAGLTAKAILALTKKLTSLIKRCFVKKGGKA